jgi:hypothetical protein
MSTRKPIYILRMSANGLEVHGQVTIMTGSYVQPLAAKRRVVAAFLKKLRAIGIEASPKMVEVHR